MRLRVLLAALSRLCSSRMSAPATILPSPRISSHPEGDAAHHRLGAARRAEEGARRAGAHRPGLTNFQTVRDDNTAELAELFAAELESN